MKQAHSRSIRYLALLFGVSATVTFVLDSAPWPETQGWMTLALTIVWAVLCTVAYQVAERCPWLALGIFWVAIPLLSLATAIVQQEPAFAALAFIAPLLAIMIAGLEVGLLVFAGVGTLIVFVTQSGVLGIPPGMTGAVLLGAAILFILTAWIIARELTDAGLVAMHSLQQALLLVEEARSQRLELRQAEEDLLQANREQVRLLNRLEILNQIAEEARQAKQTFITNVSHELRTPLNMVIAYAELITQTPHLYGRRLPSALLADINVILRNSQHLSKLVDDVLDLSQVEMGRMALDKEWVSVQQIILAAAEAMRPLFHTKGLGLTTEIQEDLPSLFGDRTRLRQVVINLLSNAGRFTEQGGVKMRAWLEDRQIMISVADSGPGIALEDQHRLFEPFQQLDSSIRRKHGGSGLGLNISKHFVELHEGRIWLESALGAGTTFYIRLPLDSLPKPEIEAPGARRWISPFHEYYPRTRPRVASIPHVTRRYVVLDDGHTLPRFLSRYVDDVEIVPAEKIADALAHLEETPSQALVVNSANLAKGETLTDIPSRLPFDTPLFACWLTGDDSVQHLSIVRYLVKPVNGAVLLDAVRGLPLPIRTVLVADDEPDLLRLFTRILAGAPEGYRVISAMSGEEALALLRENLPDVLILDLVMPQMSGFDLLKHKESDPNIKAIPVIVVSSRDPSSQPVVSNQLLVTRGIGLSMRNLLDCVDALTEILAPAAPHERQAPPAAQTA